MSGRWPTNVILSPGAAEALDGQSGLLKSGGAGNPAPRTPQATYTPGDSRKRIVHGDAGGASKYFLQAGYEPWELEWIYANGLRPCGMEAT